MGESIKLRLVYRTHYQAVGIALIQCAIETASPIEPKNTLAFAGEIARIASAKLVRINTPACVYLAYEMNRIGLLSRDNVAVGNGAVANVADLALDSPALLPLFLQNFLDGDGALLVSLLHQLTDRKCSWDSLYHEPLFEKAMTIVLDFYQDEASSAHEFQEVRRFRDKLRKEHLAWKSRKHKVDFHLTALREFGFIEEEARVLAITRLGREFLDACYPIRSLENALQLKGGAAKMSAHLYGLSEDQCSNGEVLHAYRVFKSKGLRVVTFDQIASLLALSRYDEKKYVTSEAVLRQSQLLRKAFPDQVYLLRQNELTADSLEIKDALLSA